jgi:hypothetical protein
MTTTEEKIILETNIIKIKSWVNEVSNWFKKVNSGITEIDSILNTYNESSKNIDSINLINTWINKILVLYCCITNDISQIQIFLIKIIHDKTEYIYECNEIIKSSVMFFNILLPIINKIKNIITNNTEKNKKRKSDKDHDNNPDKNSDELLKVTNNTEKNKKRKSDKDHDNNPDKNSDELLDDKKYSKINVISTFNDIINYLQINNLCQKLTEKMQTRIEIFLNFLIEQNQNGTICIKKLNDPNIENTCLKFNTINIINKDKWIKAIEHNIEKEVFSANSIYEMLLMFGFSSHECKKETVPSFQKLNKKVQILYSKESWIYNDKTFNNNKHRLWNSNIKCVDTIRVNKPQIKYVEGIEGIDLLLKASKL